MDLLTLPRTATASALGAGSAVRSARVLHPAGSAFTATVTTHGSGTWGARLLDESATYDDVTVRLSRALGMPQPLPDFVGLAMRFQGLGVNGAPLDLLVNSAGGPPLLRHLFLPRAISRTFTSVLPYRTGSGRQIMLGARPHGDRWELLVAPTLGRWTQWGELVLGAELPAERSETLRFLPTVGADDLQEVALFRKLRHEAYVRSQRNRP